MAGYGGYIINAANQYGLDPNIALSIAARETGGDDVNAINMANNGGLMQITDESANYYGVNSMYPDWATDPMQNALAGMHILKKKITEQNGDVWAGVRAYNGAGPAADQYLNQVKANYSKLGGNFTFQGKDAGGNPFVSLTAHLRTNNPNEKFDYGAIADILSQYNPNVKNAILSEALTSRDYVNDTGFLNPDVARFVKPVSEKLMQNKIDEIKDNVGQQILQNNLNKGVQAINLINRSNNIDNKNTYASLMKSIGINVPSNTDQYIKGSDLLGSAVQQVNEQRKYDQMVQNAQFENRKAEAQIGLLQKNLDNMEALYPIVGGE